MDVNGNLTGALSIDNRLSGRIVENTIENTITGRLTVPSSVNGVSDYERLNNKPSIEDVTLIGNKTFEDLGLESIDNTELMDLLTL